LEEHVAVGCNRFDQQGGAGSNILEHTGKNSKLKMLQ